MCGRGWKWNPSSSLVNSKAIIPIECLNFYKISPWISSKGKGSGRGPPSAAFRTLRQARQGVGIWPFDSGNMQIYAYAPRVNLADVGRPRLLIRATRRVNLASSHVWWWIVSTLRSFEKYFLEGVRRRRCHDEICFNAPISGPTCMKGCTPSASQCFLSRPYAWTYVCPLLPALLSGTYPQIHICLESSAKKDLLRRITRLHLRRVCT